MKKTVNMVHIKTKVVCPDTGKKEDAIKYVSPDDMKNIYPKVFYTTCENANFCRFEKCEYKPE